MMRWLFFPPRPPPAVPDPTQLRDDLRGVFRGRLRFDPVTRAVFSTDASPFEVTPLGVATPQDAADLAALVRYAHAAGVPLVPRGAGTGLAGESLGPGLVVDLSVHFRAPPAVHADTVTVQAGVTHAELNAALAPHGRRFAPDPVSSATCTVGGMVATNASGGNAARHGYTRDHVLGLGVVWDNGESSFVLRPSSFVTRPSSLVPRDESADEYPGPGTQDAGRRTQDEGLRTIEVRAQTAALLARNADLLRTHRPRTRFDRCGYALHDVLTPAGVDLPRLLTGSEGTLALVTSATLRTVPAAGGTCLTVLGFPTLEAALRAGLALKGADGLAACDLLDARQVALARAGKADDGFGPVPADIGAALVAVFEADSPAAAGAAGRAAVAGLRPSYPVVVLADPAADPGGVARARAFRDRGVAGLYAVGAGPRPLPFAEDVAVPADELPRFVAEVQRVFRRFDLPASLLIHVPAGQVHARPFVDLADPADRAKMWPVAEAVHALALAAGGTVSSQHGTGLARTPWVDRQVGPLLPVVRELKRVFDPKNLLNPGKIVGPDPRRPAWPLRVAVAGDPWPVTSPDRGRPEAVRVPLLVTGHSSLITACNGCGDCRTREPGPVRMCPAFRAGGDETVSPRGMVGLARLLAADGPGDRPTGEDIRAVAGACVNCQMCRTDCRAGVDVPRLMLAAKAADHADRGFDRGDWLLARVEVLAALGGTFPFVANRLLGSRAARWALEKLVGLSRRRALPAFPRRTFARRAKRAGLARPGVRGKGLGVSEDNSFVAPASSSLTPNPLPLTPTKLVFFPDTFANHLDPLLGAAAVAVLRHHGFEVRVPAGLRGSGMPALAQGDAETAREAARRNVRVLAESVREGYHVVCSEPTAVLALTREYPELLADPDARLVAAHTSELTSFLWALHEAGRLRLDFGRLDVGLGHHVPCHVKALGGQPAGPRLLGLIPGVRVRTIDVGCSGMAGSWGLGAAHYAASLLVGRPMLDEVGRPEVMFGSTECGGCRLQMQDGAGKRTLHPVQYLALAYGLLPEVGAKLGKPLSLRVTD